MIGARLEAGQDATQEAAKCRPEPLAQRHEVSLVDGEQSRPDVHRRMAEQREQAWKEG